MAAALVAGMGAGILAVAPVGLTLVAAALVAGTWAAAMAEAVAIGTSSMIDEFKTGHVPAEAGTQEAINAWLAAIWKCERGATLDVKLAWVTQGGKMLPAIISELVDGTKRFKVILSVEFARHIANVAEKTMREHAEGIPEPVINMTLALRAAADKIELMVPPEMKEVRDVAENR